MRQYRAGFFATSLFAFAALAPALGQDALPDRLDKAVSPDVAPGVIDVEAFVAEMGYLPKGPRTQSDEDGRADGARKAPGDRAAQGVAEAKAMAQPPAETPETGPETPPAETAAAMERSGEALPDTPTTPRESVDDPEDAAALHELGLALAEGQGREIDLAAAATAFRKAAEAGHPGAMFELGWAFETGRGVPADPAGAVLWYERAVASGEPRAMNNLGWLLTHGKDVPRDVARAVTLYRQAAEAGEAGAMSNLGWMLENGIGTPQDLATAALWYRRAAEAGEAQAMLSLGNLHLVGDGVAEDPQAALGWFSRAYGAGRVEALSYMGEVFEKTEALRNPERAAGLYLVALEAGDRWPLGRAAASWDAATARALQTQLAARGLYDGAIDGAVGPGTRAAMETVANGAGAEG